MLPIIGYTEEQWKKFSEDFRQEAWDSYWIFNNEDSLPISEYKKMNNEDLIQRIEIVKDEDGNPVYELDSFGQVKKDKQGNPIVKIRVHKKPLDKSAEDVNLIRQQIKKFEIFYPANDSQMNFEIFYPADDSEWINVTRSSSKSSKKFTTTYTDGTQHSDKMGDDYGTDDDVDDGVNNKDNSTKKPGSLTGISIRTANAGDKAVTTFDPNYDVIAALDRHKQNNDEYSRQHGGYAYDDMQNMKKLKRNLIKWIEKHIPAIEDEMEKLDIWNVDDFQLLLSRYMGSPQAEKQIKAMYDEMISDVDKIKNLSEKRAAEYKYIIRTMFGPLIKTNVKDDAEIIGQIFGLSDKYLYSVQGWFLDTMKKCLEAIGYTFNSMKYSRSKTKSGEISKYIKDLLEHSARQVAAGKPPKQFNKFLDILQKEIREHNDSKQPSRRSKNAVKDHEAQQQKDKEFDDAYATEELPPDPHAPKKSKSVDSIVINRKSGNYDDFEKYMSFVRARRSASEIRARRNEKSKQ